MTFYLLNIMIFISYVDSLYPNELEIEDTTVSFMSASYLDILLNFDINSKLLNLMVNGMISASPSSASHIYVAMFHHHMHVVCMSLNLFDAQEFVL